MERKSIKIGGKMVCLTDYSRHQAILSFGDDQSSTSMILTVSKKDTVRDVLLRLYQIDDATVDLVYIDGQFLITKLHGVSPDVDKQVTRHALSDVIFITSDRVTVFTDGSFASASDMKVYHFKRPILRLDPGRYKIFKRE